MEYLLHRDDVKGPWREYTQHEFVRQMADGTLPVEKFKNYLIQDYLFLVRKIIMRLQFVIRVIVTVLFKDTILSGERTRSIQV